MNSEALRLGIERVVALGNRFAGSGGEAKARAFLRDELHSAGLADVHVEEFAFLAYEPRGSECRNVAGGPSLPCVGLQSTADGCVEGDAVYLGACTPDDIQAAEQQGVTLEGKVGRRRCNPKNPRLVDRCATYIVASFHTHTPTTYREPAGGSRPVGPSRQDKTNASNRRLPGFVFDYAANPPGSMRIPFGYRKDEAAFLYRYGPVRRPTPP